MKKHIYLLILLAGSLLLTDAVAQKQEEDTVEKNQSAIKTFTSPAY